MFPFYVSLMTAVLVTDGGMPAEAFRDKQHAAVL
jgi:hypothetical protein